MINAIQRSTNLPIQMAKFKIGEEQYDTKDYSFTQLSSLIEELSLKCDTLLLLV